MTLKDKIEMQAQDTTQVYLHQEGIFYKVYNEGAFLLNYLGYKVKVKYIKNLNQEIYSIGFPLAVLNKLAETHTIIEEKNIKKLYNTQLFDMSLYNDWCKQCKSTIPKVFDLYDEVLNFPLAKTTPIDTYMWLYNLQKKISN